MIISHLFSFLLLGVNSGVMLIHAPRLRNGDWQNKMVAYYKTYRYNMTWGDQDLINIYFSFFPGMWYSLVSFFPGIMLTFIL